MTDRPPTISPFDIVCDVIKTALKPYEDPTGHDILDAYRAIGRHIEEMRIAYRDGAAPLNYADPLFQIGYVYRHASINGYAVQLSISRCSELRNHLLGNHSPFLSICSVGGGPGTELIGLTCFLAEQRRINAAIKFTVLDQVEEWSDMLQVMSTQCEHSLQRLGGATSTISAQLVQTCFTDPLSFNRHSHLAQNHETFIFNYVVSENLQAERELRCNLEKLVQNAPRGSFFVFVERLDSDSKKAVRRLASSSGLRNIWEEELAGRVPGKSEMLDIYRTFFGHQWYRMHLVDKETGRPKILSVVAQKV